VLVVEDDGPLGEAIVRGLRQRALGVDLARDGAEALEKLASVDYDVVVLDRDLPVVHGDEVCRQLNESQSMTRVLMLTASRASPSARTTTCRSRSRCRSCTRGCARSAAGPLVPALPGSSGASSSSIRRGGGWSGPADPTT
jgi:CheY-like chemotaxis protein